MQITKNRLVFSSVSSTLLLGAALSASAFTGCSPAESTPATGSGGAASGGAPGSGGKSGSGGATSTGGSSSSGGSTGSGGAVASGGSPGSGGVTTSGSGGSPGSGGVIASGGSPGSGGVTTSGSGGASPVAGRSGTASGGRGGSEMSGAGGMSMTGTLPSNPSAGCGKTGPQTGSSGSPLTVSGHQYYVKLPAAYDGKKAYPLIMMFNPTNNPLNWAEQNAGFETNGAKDGAIRAYPGPASMQDGWGSRDVSFFMPFYTELTSKLCVDLARVFAAGESSGGDFSSILGCEYANVLRATGPCATKAVSGYPLDAKQRKCTGQVTAVVIHGKMDTEVGTTNGPLTRDFYLALNHCGTMSTPVPGYTDAMSNCVQYQGCDAGHPVYWCLHTDPEYNGTNHGWPHFANKFLWELWSSF